MTALTRRLGDLDIAEEAAAEAFATAVERWPTAHTPNPGAWLTTTAVRKAIDRIRRENKRDDKLRRGVPHSGGHRPLTSDRRARHQHCGGAHRSPRVVKANERYGPGQPEPDPCSTRIA
jgi:predicted RNA polymerase sigma factor